MSNREKFNFWWDKQKERWDPQYQDIFESIAWKAWETAHSNKFVEIIDFDGRYIVLKRSDVLTRVLELFIEKSKSYNLDKCRVVIGLIEKHD